MTCPPQRRHRRWKTTYPSSTNMQTQHTFRSSYCKPMCFRTFHGLAKLFRMQRCKHHAERRSCSVSAHTNCPVGHFVGQHDRDSKHEVHESLIRKPDDRLINWQPNRSIFSNRSNYIIRLGLSGVIRLFEEYINVYIRCAGHELHHPRRSMANPRASVEMYF